MFFFPLVLPVQRESTADGNTAVFTPCILPHTLPQLCFSTARLRRAHKQAPLPTLWNGRLSSSSSASSLVLHRDVCVVSPLSFFLSFCLSFHLTRFYLSISSFYPRTLLTSVFTLNLLCLFCERVFIVGLLWRDRKSVV